MQHSILNIALVALPWVSLAGTVLLMWGLLHCEGRRLIVSQLWYLSVCDAAVCCYAIVKWQLLRDDRNCWTTFITEIFMKASTVWVAAIAVGAFLHLTATSSLRAKERTKRLRVLTHLAAWPGSALVNLPYLLTGYVSIEGSGIGAGCIDSPLCATVSGIVKLALFFVTLVAYVACLRVVERTRRLAREAGVDDPRFSEGERQIWRGVSGYVAVFICAWLPSAVLDLPLFQPNSHTMNRWSVAPEYTQGGLNAVVFFILNAHVRQLLVAKACRCWCRSGSDSRGEPSGEYVPVIEA